LARTKPYKMQIQENIELSKYTSFKIGGKASFFADVKNRQDLVEALNFAKERQLKVLMLGGGTNMLIRDSGFDGLVIRNLMKGIGLEAENIIAAETGLTLPEINNFGYKNGLVGFEKLATVPGTLGGALYNNAHYLGLLLSDLIDWVEVVDSSGSSPVIKRVSKEQMRFGYDTSIVKTDSLIAVRAGIKLVKGDISVSKTELIKMLKQRSEHQPYGTFNSGCMFQNVKASIGPGHNGTSTGWLIEQCGLKGTRVGNAVISEKHGNFFINMGGAGSGDILKLAEICQNKVKEKFGVDLEFEIKII